MRASPSIHNAFGALPVAAGCPKRHQTVQWHRFLALPLLYLAWLQPALADSLVESGHSAIWHNPARSGEGWTLQVLDDERAVLAWFTYDDNGAQRWMTDLGRIERDAAGEYIAFPALTVTRGGRFGPDFDPAAVVREVVGRATLRFDDCHHGTFAYTAYGQSQTIPIERLTRTMAAGCAPIHGIPGEPVFDYAGQSGSWFDPGHDGEGFLLLWMPHNEAVLAWYSYDTQGHQAWRYAAGGKREGDRIVFPTLHTARGGRFGAAFDPAQVQLSEWGRLELDLGCDRGVARYDSPLPEYGSGTQTLTRLLHLQRPACPWVKPKLTDLYDITVTEIPIEPGTPMEPNFIVAKSVANDGTVAATVAKSGKYRLLRWPPVSEAWEVLSVYELGRDPAFISSDGGTILAETNLSLSDGVFPEPVFFRDGMRETLPGLIFRISSTLGSSEDLSRVVGSGRMDNESPNSPWIWDAQNGQASLPIPALSIGGPSGGPTAASNDGSIVVGYSHHFRNLPGGGQSVAGTFGIRWANGAPAQLLRDSQGRELGGASACSADCKIVFGVDSMRVGSVGQAWFWKSFTEMGYLGASIASEEDPYITAEGIADVSADGSLAVGRYSAGSGSAGLPQGALIWTQDTGLVSVPELLVDLGHALDWSTMAAPSVSSDGRYVLLQGDKEVPSFPSSRFESRAAVLKLVGKQQPP